MLFTPININKLTLRNRIIMPAMVTGHAAINGEVSDRLINYHAERAKGGVGLQIVEACYVELGGNCYARGLGLSDDLMIKGFKKLTDAIHANGGKAALQLMHGGRIANPPTSLHPRRLVSYVPGLTPYDDVRVMDIEEIEYIIDCFKKAAERAIKAGFDAIEIHGAHGYLIAQFMSPYTNKRDDIYGGCLENRMRFPVEILKAIRSVAGPDFPILFRYSINEYVPNGVTPELAKDMAKIMVENGIDALHFSAGLAESNQYTIPSGALGRGWNADGAEAIKEAIGSKVPVSVAGRINNRETAEAILASGKADLVSMGRGLLADPNAPIKMQEKKDAEIRPCVACNDGCVGKMSVGFTCAVNPRTGYEGRYPMTKVDHPKRVVVVGGGPAGMQAALTAAERGHEVALYDKNDELGGLVNVAMLPPNKDPYTPLIAYYAEVLPKAGVNVVLNSEVTLDDIKAMAPDATLVATGSLPVVPRFCSEAPVITAEDALKGTAPVGNKVLIMGGGLVGSETAEFLAEQGKDVTILELREDIAMDMEARSRKFLMPRLKELNVKTILETEVAEIGCDKRVKIRNKYKVESWLEGFDTLVISLGYRAYNPLLQALYSEEIPATPVGDCIKAGKVMDAIHQGFLAGYAV